jgi:hypothetical protein
MNQKFINKVVIHTLVAASFVTASLQVSAAGFHTGLNNTGISISSNQFNSLLAQTNAEYLGYHFGAPDEIQTLSGTDGKRVGSVWVYHDAVQKDGQKQDANFVIIDGKLQYTTLSHAS